MADTVFPVTDQVMTRENLRDWLKGLGYNDYVLNGFEVTDGGNLDASVSAGEAFGHRTYMARDVASTVLMADNAVNHIWVTVDENDPFGVVTFHTETTDDPPVKPNVKLAKVTTASGAITDIEDVRELDSGAVSEVKQDDLEFPDGRMFKPVMFHTGMIGNQSFSAGTQIVDWGQAWADKVPSGKPSWFSEGTLNARVPVDGVYLVASQVRWVEMGNGDYVMRLQVNGANHAHDNVASDASKSHMVNQLEQIMFLREGDLLSVRMEHSHDSGTRAIEQHDRFSYFTATLISHWDETDRMPGTSAPS